ncbi:class II fructose-bisphosphate aldolase [Salibacterium halotolerans]|uniref:Fructose-bisphosphate aldolase, class II n=1 Tax=Salibacterium halotolerans TaxID=1884432 RepID=A0A1I5PMR7_9BACI|nr:class II fructose-bisphosphate aldolase [Salibacterium halotolerans]SFP34826.1 fructose-bisphosphate aldolase, class II [Salibacterium halotolerans]
MLVPLHEILNEAKKEGYAVGSFNLHCMEMLPSFIEAAEEQHSPISIQISHGTANYIGLDLIKAMVETLAAKSNVKVALHLDHNSDVNFIKKAVQAGFTSVMIDGSDLPLEENIAVTKEVVDFARPYNVSVEAEVGAIGGTEDGVSLKEDVDFTKPNDAAYFYEQTKVDALAISIGSSHGQYRSKSKLNFAVLQEISERVEIPLVLHGGTGVSYDDIQELIHYGIAKINIGTELNVRYIEEGKKTFSESPLENSLRKVLIPCNNRVKNIVKEKIEHFSKAPLYK